MDINTDQFIPATLLITTAAGLPAAVEGAPIWASSDETVLSVVPSEDGMTAAINSVAPGTARITVSADADLGQGVMEITGVSEDINVTLGPSQFASVMTLNLGTPAPKV